MALDALFKGRFCCFPKDPLDDVEVWSESVDKVLGCKGEDLQILLLESLTRGNQRQSHWRLQTCKVQNIIWSRYLLIQRSSFNSVQKYYMYPKGK